MGSTQLRLLPAAQPLLTRLGAEWFRALPTGPGVYRMGDDSGQILYVGKARNLCQRLANYRRTSHQARRTVRLIHSVSSIEWELCVDEPAALRREAELIRSLQPRFNRAGRWIAPALLVRLTWEETGCRIECVKEPDARTDDLGPFRSGVRRLPSALAQLLWLAAHPGETVTTMPHRLATPRSTSELLLGTPDGSQWREWMRTYFAEGDTSILFALAGVLGDRSSAFERAFIKLCWDELAAFCRSHPRAGIRPG